MCVHTRLYASIFAAIGYHNVNCKPSVVFRLSSDPGTCPINTRTTYMFQTASRGYRLCVTLPPKYTRVARSSLGSAKFITAAIVGQVKCQVLGVLHRVFYSSLHVM